MPTDNRTATTTPPGDWLDDARVDPEENVDRLQVALMEQEIQRDIIRHRDEQPTPEVDGGALHSNPRYLAAINAARLSARPNRPRNRTSKRAKCNSGPQYNRIRSTSTL